jgi:hemolysin-activating ACP:hemolysin acyltransferase
MALGLAVSHLMTRPAFARLRFGEWSRVLVGQINRRHYHFVIDARGHVVGFLGWAYTSSDGAESWIEGRGNFSGGETTDGKCVVFNAWSASLPEATPVLLDAARRAVAGREMIYFRRLYKDGRSRPVRLPVTDFIAGHLARSMQA